MLLSPTAVRIKEEEKGERERKKTGGKVKEGVFREERKYRRQRSHKAES